MGFFEYLSNNVDNMVELGLAHAGVVLTAIALATIIGVALGIATYKRERPREAVLAITGAFITVPSFALFILLMPIFGLGWTPVVFALTMYGLMPIVRNTITGLNGVDPAVVESAKGMGLSRRQVLTKIEMPLAWPVIITGVRVTTLVLLGIAAIGAIINGPGYGDLIFRGMARVGTDVAVNLILAGTVGVMILAIIFDLGFHGVRRLTTSKGIR